MWKTEFDQGDSPEKFLKLGKEFLEEELRKEEENLRARRSRNYSGKKDNKSWRKVNIKKLSKTSTQVINYQGMQYAPEGELGVVYLFSKLQRKLGYLSIVRLGDAFPDCEAIKLGGKRVQIEFEFRSGNFLPQHGEDGLKKVNEIVCWEDNWPPAKRGLLQKHRVAIIELRDLLGLGRNIWFHVIKKRYHESYMEDLLHGPKTLALPCHKSAKKGDLLLDYFGAPMSFLKGIELLTSDAYRTKSRRFKYRSEIRRIGILNNEIHMNRMKSEKSLVGAFFFKQAGLMGSPRITEYWPQLSALILRLNPQIKSKIRKYTSWD
ncbi:MAG: hypothetical protein MUP41_04575 [Desulfobacterales bacterium]|nr:hypothetical protein [Desulfobacterales bacterium]